VAGGGFGEVGAAGDLPWYYLTGGVLGAAYVTTVLVSVRTLGAGGVTAATIAGQLTMSVLLDRSGWLGLDERALTLQRVVGIALLAAGTFLIVRE
jgi:transporter family-2 protein